MKLAESLQLRALRIQQQEEKMPLWKIHRCEDRPDTSQMVLFSPDPSLLYFDLDDARYIMRFCPYCGKSAAHVELETASDKGFRAY